MFGGFGSEGRMNEAFIIDLEARVSNPSDVIDCS